MTWQFLRCRLSDTWYVGVCFSCSFRCSSTT